jgi:hypothetical protein
MIVINESGNREGLASEFVRRVASHNLLPRDGDSPVLTSMLKVYGTRVADNMVIEESRLDDLRAKIRQKVAEQPMMEPVTEDQLITDELVDSPWTEMSLCTWIAALLLLREDANRAVTCMRLVKFSVPPEREAGWHEEVSTSMPHDKETV